MNNNILKNFYVIEGIEGSGKSTLAKALVAELNKDCKDDQNIKAIYTSEPTNSNIGKVIREALQNKIQLSEKTLMYLFAADRANHVEEITELCNRGIKVICDRYLFSSMAYQSLNLDMKDIYEVNKNFPLPAKLFYLSINSNVALKRVNGRKGVEEKYDRLDIIKKVKDNYEFCFRNFFEKNQYFWKNVCYLNGLFEIKSNLDFILSYMV